MRSDTSSSVLARSFRRLALPVACIALLFVAAVHASPTAMGGGIFASFEPLAILQAPGLNSLDQFALVGALVVALAGLLYAWKLSRDIYRLPTGTPGMQAIALAVRQGADAYLRRQFQIVGILVVVITAGLIASKWPWGYSEGTAEYDDALVIALGRGAAFFFGAIFSATVGFIGMRLATAGNLRVAAAARDDFGTPFRIAYRTGTVTGMLTVGLGLLGGTLIVLIFGDHAFEILIGYGFGGSLLALFMRVGGGIYTKAADVGADLVGKLEANMAEDDPRNAATIADNVGDNVGDCAGMAADVFESYAVTMVAAVMLGYAAFGPKGMIFPLVVQAVGVLSSMISTALVGRGLTQGTSPDAMRRINYGFWRSAVLSVMGFGLLGFAMLRFDAPYIVGQAIDRGMHREVLFLRAIGVQPLSTLEATGSAIDNKRLEVGRKWRSLPFEEQTRIATLAVVSVQEGEEGQAAREGQSSYVKMAQRYVPLTEGLDLSAVYASLIGILLAIALNRCTEYWTSTDYSPVKNLTKSCRTGHATNIISGLALGFESAVWAALLIALAIGATVMIFYSTNSPIFIAYGVAMCGIGMLTLTGDTISMDVFGPISDNASGIGEMGYNRDENGRPLSPGDADYLSPTAVNAARRRLTDLDAVGNTTKAITKGIAIGSAVIAAVSLFASFVAVLVTGSEDKVARLTSNEFVVGQAPLTIADPMVFIGLLLGAAVPFLFSSMTIRAVGRAAYLIVSECRAQFRNPKIMDGTEKPDYGRVVSICTSMAQRELFGPGVLAIFTPLVVGFLLGPFALGGFLAGMIVSGQLLAVFMSNAGGAWDNAKKMVEDQPRSPRTGKGSELHRASITGDTVGDPFKDTAGPAINPLIKVMNLVSLLALPFVLTYNLYSGLGDLTYGVSITGVSLVMVLLAWRQSKQPSKEEKLLDDQFQEEEDEAIRSMKDIV